MLSAEGWINGITGILLLIFSLVFGLFCIYKSMKDVSYFELFVKFYVIMKV